MKKISTLVILIAVLFFAAKVSAQNNVGIGITNPDASSILHLESTSKGFIAPRMTTAQRTAIAAPANGLLVYDITLECLYYFTTTNGWTSLCQATGPTGNTGAAGAQGPTGLQGVTGAAGTNGTNGVTGDTGPQGIQGVTGTTGAGTTGATGAVGVTGGTGATGLQGLQGVTGAVGATGVQGIQGVTGVTGAQGITGAGTTGTTGATGVQGVTGDTGVTGLQGIQGVTGAVGSTGVQGIQGVTGVTGAQGVTGSTGALGIQGITGDTGTTGSQGIQGVTGVTGIQGVTGAIGVTGAQGTTGITGAQGITGTTGIQGVTGVTGITGAQGIIGITGTTGVTGVTGPNWTITNFEFNNAGTLNITTTAPQNLNTTIGAWLTKGNTGITNPAVPATYGTSTIGAAENWIGTTDAKDFTIGTNQVERVRVKQANGYVGIGTASPSLPLEVSSGVLANAIYGHSNSVGAYVGYEVNITLGTPVQTLQGAGIYSTNPAAGYASIYGQSTGAATVAALIDYSTVWMANYAYVDNNSGAFNPSTSYNQLNVTSTTLAGINVAVRGYNTRAVGGNPGWCAGGRFDAGAAGNAEDANGVMAFATGPGTGADPAGGYTTSFNVTAGGYFQGNAQWAYVAMNGATNRKIIGTGSVSEIISTENHGRITLTAPESPEYWYTDYGTVKLENGFAHVALDPILSDIIFVNAENPLRVFCTPTDMDEFNGVVVKNRNEKGFDLVELNGGKHSGTLDYELIAKPKTNYGEGRFPQAPGPAAIKADKEPAAAKAANQLIGKTIFHWANDWDVYHYNPEELTGIGDVVIGGPHMGQVKLADGKYGNSIPADRRKLEGEKH